MTNETGPDAFTLAMLSHRVDGIAEEMALGLVRSSSSMLIRNALDFTTAICDEAGGLVALGPGIPMNLSAVTDACRHAMTRAGQWTAGDVVVLNDPYNGGTHLNDFFLVEPIVGPERSAPTGYVVVAAHMTDVGGTVPGSMNYRATEIFQEGLRIPPTFLRNGQTPNEALVSLIAGNGRYPADLRTDLHAMLTAADTGVREVTALIAEVGEETLLAVIRRLDEESARSTGAWLQGLGRRAAEFTDFIDARGETPGAAIHVTATTDGERLRIDFGGTTPQVPGSINSPLSFTRSCAAVAVRCAMAEPVRLNDGFLGRIEVVAEEGSVVHAQMPAACGHRGITGYRVFDAVLGALVELGATARAAGEGGTMSCMLDGLDTGGDPFAARFAFLGSWGASAEEDGIEGITNPCANLANVPVELLEQRYPLRFAKVGFLADSEGVGQYRGGLSTEVVFDFVGNQGAVDIRCDRTATPPYGIAGGGSGSKASAHLLRNDHTVDLNKSGRVSLEHGDRVHLVLASGGGSGDPLQRDPDAVRRDVWAGKVSAARASEVYGTSIEKGG